MLYRNRKVSYTDLRLGEASEIWAGSPLAAEEDGVKLQVSYDDLVY